MFSGESMNMLEKEIRHRMKTVFGKGPDRIKIIHMDGLLAIELGGFLTKVERLRLEESGGLEGIRQFRYIEMKKEMEEFLKHNILAARVFKNIYLDVHPDIDSACFVAYEERKK